MRPPPPHPLIVTPRSAEWAPGVLASDYYKQSKNPIFQKVEKENSHFQALTLPQSTIPVPQLPIMADSTVKLLENGLPNINRYITTTDPSRKAILSNEIPSTSIWQKTGSIANFFLGCMTRTFPVVLSSTNDISSYNKDLSSPPGLTVSNGTVLRYVDMTPDTISPMHKTASLDYGIVLEGEIELVLDSGETQLMRRGDICVQRGTNHA